MKSGLVLKLAAVIAALVMVLLPEEAYVLIWAEVSFIFIILVTLIAISGWGYIVVFFLTFRYILQRIGKVIITHQVIGLGEKAIDAAIIYLIIFHGVAAAVLIATPLYFMFVIFVIRAYDFFLDRGYDLLELENLRANGSSKLFLRWILKRRVTIFLVGSFYQLDPDGVTILLRRNREAFWHNALAIALPATLLSMSIWITVFTLAIKGYEWFGRAL